MNAKDRLRYIRDLYCSDDRPWVLAFSGGKDSTAVLQLVWTALSDISKQDRLKRVHVCYVDTGMDHPKYRLHVDFVISQIRNAAAERDMPFEMHVLEPEMKHRFFVAVIGRGYAPPTHWFRWCTRTMRIRPMSQFIRALASSERGVVLALGMRRSESEARRRILNAYETGRPFLNRYGSLAGVTAFTPIEDLDTAQVWQLLMQTSSPFAGGSRALGKLYSIAAGGECASYTVGEGISQPCGGSRFGCWTCTVVRSDRSGTGIADLYPAFEPLLDFREWLISTRSDTRKRWKKRRNGDRGPGPLRLTTRREALNLLLDTEERVGCTLITYPEVLAIQDHWSMDGDRRSTALAIYRARDRARSAG